MHSIQATLAFTRPDDVIDPDADGVRRAASLDPDALHDGAAFAHHACTLYDTADPAVEPPALDSHGFSHVDLTRVPDLVPILERVRRQNALTAQDAAGVRAALRGRVLPLPNGTRLHILFVAPEGFIMRRGGPNGLRVTDSATALGMNDHDAAVSVHADQDVHGTPVRQLLRGAAPWVFRHDAPTSRNRRSPLALLNLWVPLQQVVRPLALMDRRTLDRKKDQLRYALPTGKFLDRPADLAVNDIWTFLHHPAQRWYFRSDATPATAWLFDTLSAPHGAFALPGEPEAERLYRALHTTLNRPDGAGARPQPPPEEPVTAAEPLRSAIDELQRCLDEAPSAAADRETAPSPWKQQAQDALDRVVRKSIEMRLVGWIRGRPFRR